MLSWRAGIGYTHRGDGTNWLSSQRVETEEHSSVAFALTVNRKNKEGEKERLRHTRLMKEKARLIKCLSRRR